MWGPEEGQLLLATLQIDWYYIFSSPAPLFVLFSSTPDRQEPLLVRDNIVLRIKLGCVQLFVSDKRTCASLVHGFSRCWGS